MLKRRLGAIVAVAGFVLALAGNGVVPPAVLSLAPTATQLGTQQLDTATMQPVNVPARPVRVAVVPGTGGTEAWAIAYSSAIVAGWTPGGLGQTVLLHYTKATGWQLTGPPVGADGSPSTARLSGIAMAAGGEGWAVGQGGVIVHHGAGDGSTWRVVQSKTQLPLTAISLSPSGATGFAVGDYDSTNHHLTSLSLSNGQWSLDGATDLSGATSLDLTAVSTVSDSGEAWAVSGDTSGSLDVIHRSGGTWQRVLTNQTQFDNPSGGQAANGGGITVGSGGVWVVGRMQSSDPTHPLGDSQAGDRSRPFAISLIGSGSSYTAKSYCPGIMTVQSGNTQSPQQNGQATYSKVCDEDFPLAAFGLTGVSSFGDVGSGEAFAAGMGLFHFVQVGGKGTWEREPDPIGFLSSLSMSAPDEGWMTGTGSNAITGAALGENMAIGHWTKHPQVPAMARWPEPGMSPLEGVALDPSGSGVALAVAGDGERVRYVPGFGWEVLTHHNAKLHGIAWPATNNAWAVGTAGTMSHWDGYAWTDTQAPRNHATDPMPTLYGVAFSDAGHGWAVGGNGVLLDYVNGSWRRDSQSSVLTNQPLYAVAAAGGVAVAAGAGGVVLVNQGGTWQVDKAAGALAQVLGTPPSVATFYSAASLPNGTLAVAGTQGVMLVRQPGRAFAPVGSDRGWTVDGTVIALALSRSGSGAPEILASVSPHSNAKYVDGTLATTDGYMFVGDASSDWSDVQWHDIELNDQSTMWTSTDTAAAHDPVYAIAIAPGTLHGWAVGGYPSLTLDDSNQSSERQTSSGSVYRVDLAGSPNPPSSLISLPSPPASGYTFAFLGDSACSAGICGAALGSGATADTVLQEAQQEIEMVDPSLTVFGGNMRGTGYPSELSVFKRYMQNWTMPVVAALGDQDTSGALNPSNIAPGAPNQSGLTTNTPYLNLFNDMPAPWGHGQDTRHLYNGLVSADVAADSAPTPGQANNHYAFDFQPPGLPAQVRFIVLDDSSGTLSKSQDNPAETAGNTQLTWFQSELADAHSKGLQTIVVMNTPSDDPRSATPGTGLTTDGVTFDQNVSMNGVSAVFASHINGNMRASISTPGGASVPLFVSGGGGSPLEGSRNSLHGYYHSWLLVTVDPDHKTQPGGQATVTVQSMPVIESVAMRIDTPSPEAGVFAGHASQVYGLGRLPDSGIGNLNGPNPDATQSKADYVQFPPAFYGAGNCLPTTGQPGTGELDTCSEPYALSPYHRFWSEDENIAAFVKPCGLAYAPYGPCVDGANRLIPDRVGQYGYLCAIKPGKVWIDVLMGIHLARELVTVNPGAGPCNEHPLPPPPPPNPKTVPPVQPVVVQPNAQTVVAPQPRPLVPARHPHIFHSYNSNLVPAVLPPPVPVLAAAPPLPAAGTAAKKEEKREHAIEHSQESGGGQTHHAVIRADADAHWDPRPAAVGGAAAFLMLVLLATWSAARRDPASAIDRRRWE
jgi:hypothetical protein